KVDGHARSIEGMIERVVAAAAVNYPVHTLACQEREHVVAGAAGQALDGAERDRTSQRTGIGPGDAPGGVGVRTGQDVLVAAALNRHFEGGHADDLERVDRRLAA